MQRMLQLRKPLEYPFGLFVAPEYLLASPSPTGSHGMGSQRHMSETEKDQRLQTLKAISRPCKGMIMIPGTIAWQKSFLRTGAKQFHSKGPLVGQLKAVSRQTKATNAVNFYANRQNLGLNHPLSAPLENNLGQVMKVAPTTQDKLNELANQAGPLFTTADFARNTAYVLLDGNVLMKYNKQGDFHEVMNGNTAVHIPGTMDGRFQVKVTDQDSRPIDFGLEICLDHVYQTTGKEIPHLGQVDIHIISSAQVQDNRDNVAVKPGGYLVHACSNHSNTAVKQMKSLFFKQYLSAEKPFYDQPVQGIPLQCWEIGIDLSRLQGSPQEEIEKRRFY